MNSFNRLPLSKAMLENLESLEYMTMTPVQENTISPILEGKDILAQAKTGSGKTAAFGIGLLHNLKVERYRVQAMVLCPTRELAEQVAGELRRLARFKHNIKLLKLTGGLPAYRQEHSLRHQAHIVVGTPGRVLKLLTRGALSLDDVKTIVLDEADRLLDMGFVCQIEDILKHAPAGHQTLCFSATFSDEVKALSKSILTDPEEIYVDTRHESSVINQYFYKVCSSDKIDSILCLLAESQPASTIIFCNTKDVCREVGRELNRRGVNCLALHGDLEQRERNEILIRFANESCRVLVATDVAARGLDIEELGAVINHDLPFETETYIHRIGRTGRAGRGGVVFSLMISGENFRLNKINEYMGTDFSGVRLNSEQIDPGSGLEATMVTLSVNGGRKNKISPGDLLGALTVKDGIPGCDVGKIDRQDNITFIAVKRDSARKAFRILENGMIKGRRFKVMIHG